MLALEGAKYEIWAMNNTITKEMATALSKFQEACPEINLDGTVSFGQTKFKYATLGNIIKLTKGPLKEAGLVVTQPIIGKTLHTILTCLEDGSALSASMELPDRNKLQETGADITYCRRYMYVSMLGIVGDDDKDAEREVPKKSELTEDNKAKVIAKIAASKKGVLNGNGAEVTMQRLRNTYLLSPQDEIDILQAIEMKIEADK